MQLSRNSGLKSLIQEDSFSTPNSVRASRDNHKHELEVGLENRVGRVNSTRRFTKTIRLRGKEAAKNVARDSKDLAKCYRKVTLECMVPVDEYRGCVEQLVDKASSLGVIVLR